MSEPDTKLVALQRFIDAWGRRDPDAVAACMAPQAIYSASVGPEPGATYVGREAIRAGVVEMFARDKGGRMQIDTPILMGDVALLTWTYHAPAANDASCAIRGCDIFRFEEGAIVLKDAFRKTPS
ncbi:nuclear transport factor 2 family protein [Caulobacter sp. 1776]|uniref:nuclear transport factor 2 family protein n=1 Tax=Caulobacter sp. 1776 TaxID=3156420 RepID=UPI0033991F47